MNEYTPSAVRRLQILQTHLTFSDCNLESELFSPAYCLSAPSITLIGSMILDVQGTPAAGHSFHQGGSVPGTVRFLPGGVARNIAHTLTLLCPLSSVPKPMLITAVGDDAAAQTLIASCHALGMSTRGVLSLPHATSPSVSILFNSDGDVAAAVADVDLLERALTPAVLRQYQADIQTSFCVLIDGDLSQNAVEAACRIASEAARSPLIWFEPVSAPKSARAINVLSLIDFISPNLAELEAMAAAIHYRKQKPHTPPPRKTIIVETTKTIEIEEKLQSIRPLLQLVLEQGVGHILLTLGIEGAVLCSFSSTVQQQTIAAHYAPALPATVKNCSGAGDCLVAGFLHALCTGKSAVEALSWGIAAAKCAVESEMNVSELFDMMELKKDAEITAHKMKLYIL